VRPVDTPKTTPEDAGADGSTKPPKAEPRWSATSDWWLIPYDPESCLPGGPSWVSPPICGKGGGCTSGGAHPRACTIVAKDPCSAELAATCARALPRLADPVVAQAAECLEWAVDTCGTGQGPDFMSARCAMLAAFDACNDPTVATTCTALVALCKNPRFQLDACLHVFSGLSPAGRTSVESCMRTSGCAIGPAECLALR
jgi:hypothetical protein